MRNPVVALTIDDARALGRVTSPGWAGDFLPGANNGWVLAGMEYLSSFKGFAPRGSVALYDMLLTGSDTPASAAAEGTYYWDIAATNGGLWDDRATPSYYGNRFLHMYSGGTDPTGKVTCSSNIPPVWMGVFYAYAIPNGRVLPGQFSIEMQGAGAGYPSWRIVIPRGHGSSFECDSPYLSLDPYGNGNAQRVSVCNMRTAQASQGLTEYIVLCELTLNQWIINISVNGKALEEPWVYTPPGCDVADPFLLDAVGNETPISQPGPIEVTTDGQQLMFALNSWQYPVFSTAYRRYYHAVDTRCGDVHRATAPLIADAYVVKPTGAEANVEVATGTANEVGVEVQAGLANQSVRPVCGVVSVVMDAIIGDVTTAPWTSTGGSALDGKISYTRRSTWKGNEVTATLRDPTGALTWKGNDVVTLSAAWQTTPAAPTLKKLFTGYLTGPTRRKEGSDDLTVEIHAADFVGSRMKRKDMIFTRSYGGVEVNTAIQELGNRLGFTTDRIVCTDGVGVYLPHSQVIGEPTLAWGAGDKVDAALDAICKAVGMVWGIDVDGKLFVRYPVAYSGTPDFVLDNATVTEADEIWGWETEREMAEFATDVYAVSGAEGFRRFSWARNLLAQDTPSNGAFIGDNFQFVEKIERAWVDTQTIATATLGKRSQFEQVVTWKPVSAIATLDPGMICQSQLTGTQLTYNSLYLIIEERGEIDLDMPNDFGWSQTFTMVKVG